MYHNLLSHRDNDSAISDEGSTSVDTCSENTLKITNKIKAKDVPRNLTMRVNVKKRSDKFDLSRDKTPGKNSSLPRRVSSKSRSLVKKQCNNGPECTKSKKITNYAQIKKKISMPAIRSTNSNMTRLKINSKSAKNKKNTKGSCSSLIDLRIAKNCNSLPLPPVPKGSDISLMSPRMNFVRGVKSNYQKKRINYLEQFDFLYNSRLFNQWETNTGPFLRNMTLSLVPKTPSTESLPLRKRTYGCGIVSVKESEHNTAEENKKGDEKAELNAKAEKSDSDDLSSSGNSDLSISSVDLGDKKCSYAPASESGKWDGPSATNLIDSPFHPTSLSIHEPIRMKCIDEAAEQMKDLILYSEEFLKGLLKEKGDSVSKLDTLESILKHSRRYKGKPLRMLLEAETSIRKLNGNSKYPENVWAPNSKGNKKIPPSYGMKTSGKAPPESKNSNKTPLPRDSKSYAKTPSFHDSTTKTPSLRNSRIPMKTPSPYDSRSPFKYLKKSSTIPCCHKDTVNSPKSLNKRRNPFMQKSNPRKELEPIGVQSSVNESCIPSRAVTPEYFSGRRSKSSFGKLTDLNYSTGNECKSITALKRVNVEEIIASDFRHFFHYFAVLGGRLKSGAVISKQNSHVWLKQCGIIHDEHTLNVANECFSTIARRKLVLNISDYVQYLMAVARRQRMIPADIIRQLMSVDIQSLANRKNEMRTVHSADELGRTKTPQSQQWKLSSSVSKLTPQKS